MNEDELIEEDKRNNPNCGYSQSIQKSCQTNKDNQYLCQTLKRITRNCPGQQGVEIFSNTTTSQDPMNNIPKPYQFHEKQFSPFDNNRHDNIDNIDPFAIFDNMMERFIGDSLLNFDKNNINPHHRQYQSPKSYDQYKKDVSPFSIPPHKIDNQVKNNNGISGPIEKV